MSRVRKFITTHFAENGPPERERRELWFTKDPQKNKDTLQSEGGVERGRPHEQREEAPGAGITQLRERLTVVVPEGTIPEIERVYGSEELWEQAVGWPPLRTKIEEELRKRGCELPFETPDGKTIEQQLLDQGIVSPEQRAAVLRELISQHPDVVLNFTQYLEQRLKQHDEYLRIEEYKLNLLSNEHRSKGGSYSVKLQQFAAEQELAETEQDEREQERHEQEARTLRKDLLDQFPEGKSRNAVSFLLDQWWAATRNSRKFGLSSRWREPLTREEEEKTRTLYVASLSEKTSTLRRYLDAQLRTKAEELRARSKQLWEEVQAKIKEGAKPEDLTLGGKPNRSCANTRALALWGIGIDSLEQAFTDASNRLLTIKRTEGGTKPPPLPEQKEFLDHAEESLRHLEQMTDRLSGGLKRFVTTERREQEETERWAIDTAKRLRMMMSRRVFDEEKFREFLGDELWGFLVKLHEGWIDKQGREHASIDCYADAEGNPEKLAQIRSDPLLRITGTDAFSDVRIQEAITSQLLVLEYDLEGALKDKRKLEMCQKVHLKPEELHERDVHAQHELETVHASLLANPALGHPVCSTLGIREQLEGKIRTLTFTLQSLTGSDPALKQKTLEALPKAEQNPQEQLITTELELEKLKDCDAMLRSIRVEYIPAGTGNLPAGMDGWYSYDSETIYVDQNLAADQRADTEEHERGHAIVDILSRRSRVFPLLIPTFYEELEAEYSHKTGEKGQLRNLLEHVGERWKIKETVMAKLIQKFKHEGWDDKLAEEKARDFYLRHMVIDELVNKHATRRGCARPQGVDETSEGAEAERELFSLLNQMQSGMPSVTADEKLASEPLNLNIGLPQRHEEEEQAERDEGLPPEEAKRHNPKQDLLETAQNIQKMKAFAEQYPDSLQYLRGPIADAEHWYDRLNTILIEGRDTDGTPFPHADQHQGFINAVKALKKYTREKVDKIEEIKIKMLDISKVSPTRHVGKRFRVLSILDIMKIYQNIKEDIITIWQRRQDRALSEVGDAIFGIFPDNWLYVGQLKQYHKRRYSGAELEAVEKWVKALENEDSHTLLETIPYTNNRDQVRGIIELLSTKRGEMDWNHEGVWRKLMEFSGYNMPIEACKGDAMLRDTWLRRMITEIWHDKEKFDEWRTANDSKYKSAMADFTPTVDALSNRPQGMGAELQRQLKLFVEWDKAGRRYKLPYDIKPQRYEEVIDYAIRMGKMSMEQKFYYLVRGIAVGLLSADRLNVIESKYLNLFPFLDYFYQRNNTLPEIKALATQLTERVGGEDTYQPGIRTTVWLQLQNARDANVKFRLSKGVGKANAENIDHEDIPFFVSQFDWKKVDSLADVISGTRQKTTDEGWKNAYAGFSSKLKVFGKLAAAEGLGIDRLTKADAADLAQTIVAYLHMDNILTRNGADKPGRPRLTETDYSNPSPSLARDRTVGEYRLQLNRLTRELITAPAIRAAIENNADWRRKVDELHDRDAQGAITREFTLEDYIRGLEEGGALRKNNSQISAKAHDATEVFSSVFERAILDKLDLFKRILRGHSDDLLEELGSEGQVTDANVQQALRGRAQVQRMGEAGRAA